MSMPRIFAGRRRRLVGMLVANGIAQAVCGFGLALSLRGLMNEADRGALAPAFILSMMGLAGLLLTLRVREGSDAERLGQDYVTRVRLRIFDRVAGRAPHARGARRSGVTLTRLVGDLNSLRNWVSQGIARAIVASISVVGLLCALFYFSWMAGTVMAGVTAASVAAWGLLTPTLRGYVREARRRRGRLANNLSEKVLAARTIWQLGRADHERDRIRRQSGQLRDALVRRSRMSALLRSSSELVWPIAIVGVLASGIATARPTSELVVSILLVGMIVAALGQIARAWDHRISFEEGMRRIGETLSEPRIREARDAVPLSATGPLSLEYDAVTVEGAFVDLTVRVEPGERLLVVDSTGSGKSTLLALAARMREPDRGAIRLDDVEIDRIELDSLHAAVQIVSAELPLLRGTVAENVSYAIDDADPEWLKHVCEVCRLADDPALSESGLETRVEERGSNLPLALRQRIMLARAVAMRPRLLLIDEPALLLEPRGREALAGALDLVDATVVIAANEPTATPAIDRILHLPGGWVDRPSSTLAVAEGVRLH